MRQDFDDVVSTIKQVDTDKTSIIFNCQMGRGRTTTGMVIATMMEEQNTLLRSMQQVEDLDEEGILTFYKGEYKVILREVRVLDQVTPSIGSNDIERVFLSRDSAIM